MSLDLHKTQDLVLVQPLATRIFHWVQFYCVIGLMLTGLYLHNPSFVDITMNLARKAHSFLGFALIINTVCYIYYYLITGYHHSLIFDFQDIKHLPSFLKYVFFIEKKHPYYGKYNPGQKLIYTFWLVLLVFMLISGLALFNHDRFQWFFHLTGGFQRVRFYHFIGLVGFIATIPIHIYLVFTEDPAKLQAIFTGYIKKS